MPTQYCDCKGTLPYSVLRYVRAFGPRMRAALVKALEQRQETKDTLTAQDIAECIATAWAMLEADIESCLEFPSPDQNRVDIARKQAQAGEGSTIDEIANLP